MRVLFIPLTALILTTLISCNKESEPNNRKESEYAIICPIDFVLLGEDNADLIDFNDSTTFPIAFMDSIPQISKDKISRFQNSCIYNGNANEIIFSKELKNNIWKTIVYGYDNIRKYETHVYFNTYKTDTITTKSSFSTECYGRDYCATIDEIYYNRILIYSNGKSTERLEPKCVYITKTKTKTIVRTE